MFQRNVPLISFQLYFICLLTFVSSNFLIVNERWENYLSEFQCIRSIFDIRFWLPDSTDFIAIFILCWLVFSWAKVAVEQLVTFLLHLWSVQKFTRKVISFLFFSCICIVIIFHSLTERKSLTRLIFGYFSLDKRNNPKHNVYIMKQKNKADKMGFVVWFRRTITDKMYSTLPLGNEKRRKLWSTRKLNPFNHLEKKQ